MIKGIIGLIEINTSSALLLTLLKELTCGIQIEFDENVFN